MRRSGSKHLGSCPLLVSRAGECSHFFLLFIRKNCHQLLQCLVLPRIGLKKPCICKATKSFPSATYHQVWEVNADHLNYWKQLLPFFEMKWAQWKIWSNWHPKSITQSRIHMVPASPPRGWLGRSAHCAPPLHAENPRGRPWLWPGMRSREMGDGLSLHISLSSHTLPCIKALRVPQHNHCGCASGWRYQYIYIYRFFDADKLSLNYS